jgi:hypothetical protein
VQLLRQQADGARAPGIERARAQRVQGLTVDDSRRGASYQDDLEAWSVGLNYRVTEDTVFRLDHTWYLPERGDDRTEWAASLSTYF